MNRYAVIVAGGSGTRMGGGIPKQFRSLCGRPLLWWSLAAFHKENPETKIIVVLPENFVALWKDLFRSLPEQEQIEHEVTVGGSSRTESVCNGLSLISDNESLVAVHDGARPLVTSEMISDGWKTALNYDACVPVVPVTDSLRKLSGDESEAVDRSKYVAVQTPQVFKTGLLQKSYEKAKGESFTDDASVVENSGHKIKLFKGNTNNIKVTHPGDFDMVELLIRQNA